MHHIIINLPSRPAANASQLVIIIIIIPITAITYLDDLSELKRRVNPIIPVNEKLPARYIPIVIENINIIIIQYRYTKPVAPVPVVVNILYVYFRY